MRDNSRCHEALFTYGCAAARSASAGVTFSRGGGVTGGTAAVPEGVARQAAAAAGVTHAEVVRFAGATRTHTAALVAKAVLAANAAAGAGTGVAAAGTGGGGGFGVVVAVGWDLVSVGLVVRRLRWLLRRLRCVRCRPRRRWSM